MTVSFLPPLAQATESLTATEWNPPRTPLGWGVLAGVSTGLLAWTVWLYVRDARSLPRAARAFLLACRIGVLVCLGVVAFDPRERTQTTAVRPSRVAVLVDRSQSMRFPAGDPGGAADDGDGETRAAAVGRAIAVGELIDALRERHSVQVFAFDATAEQVAEFPKADPTGPAAGTGSAAVLPEAAFEPDGAETRLGEAVADAVRQTRGPTLAGVVVFSDGGQNAGAGPDAAVGRAARENVPLLTVGVGGTEPPTDVRVADVSAPTDVRYAPERERQDPFEVRSFLAADGLAGKTATLTLSRADADAPAGTGDGPVVETRTLPLPADGETAEVTFEREPTEAGRFRYTVKLAPPPGVRQVREDDDSRSVVVTARSRPTAVLLIAGGPNRDYRFLQTALARQATAEVDVLLQSVSPDELPGVTQDGDALLAEFPQNFPVRPPPLTGDRPAQSPDAYDVVLAMDADFARIDAAGRTALRDWVDGQRGGFVFAAGDVYTPQLTDDPEFAAVRDLLPVRLAPRSIVEATDANARAWAPELTDAATAGGVLDLDPRGAGDLRAWRAIEGFYRAYPTRGAKELAEILMLHGDPGGAGGGRTVLLADQRFGGGRVFYLGTSEIWRLRKLGPGLFERFWTNVIRAAAEGRATAGDAPARFLLDARSVAVGEPVRVRADVRDRRGAPSDRDRVTVEIDGPDGNPVPASPLTLLPASGRPGQFEATFVSRAPGRYVLRLDPREVGGEEPITAELDAELPALERRTVRQDVPVLTALGEGTGGAYLPLADLAALPDLIEPRDRIVTVDESVRALWDRRWMLGLIVALLGIEWLTRKLLRLA